MNENDAKKLMKMMLIFCLLQILLLIGGIAVIYMLKGLWYALVLLAMGLCYAAFGLRVGDKIDSIIKPKYPQFYSIKGRANSKAIKREAKQHGDKITLQLKSRQTLMFAATAICVIVLVLTALCVL